MIRVQVTGERGLINMARSVGEGPDHLREHLGRAVRRAAQPTLRDVKRAIGTNPIRGFPAGRRRYRGPNTAKGLRRSIAAVVELDLDVGSLSPRAQFVVRTARLGKKRRLPELIESGKRWRHPIMGNRSAWASSQGKPWFETTVTRSRPLFERRTNEAVERVARAIDRGA
jgi:hypothetical protein